MPYFDLETAPIDDAAKHLPEQHAPANYKSPEAIAAYIADAQAKALERAALDPGLLRIVAIGLQADEAGPSALLCPDEQAERIALEQFWLLATACTASGGELVGFNVLAFDLPALITRSWLLGVTPAMTTLRRYGQHGVIDLMDRLSFSGLVTFKSLDWWCQRVGIVEPDPTTGKEIPALVAAGAWETVKAHVLADVRKTVQLAAFCGVERF